jgi:transposase
MKPDLYIDCLEPGADNLKKHTPPPDPEPPEGFVDNTVKVFRLNPDGSKGELVRTMEAFPEGWDDPHKLREKRFQKQSKEDEAMVKPLDNREELIRRAKALMRDGLSLTKAAREVGIGSSTLSVWLKKERQAANPEPTQAANQEPEREEAKPATQSVAQEEPEITVKDVLMCEAAQREQGFGPEDDEPIPYQVVGKYEALGKAIGALVDEKNLQYGDAFNRGGCILEILYPDGVRPDQYRDMLGVIRVIDKLFRVANGKQGSEDPWQDIAGYGLLGTGE